MSRPTLENQLIKLTAFRDFLHHRQVDPLRLERLLEDLSQKEPPDFAVFARLRREATELIQIFDWFPQLSIVTREFWSRMFKGETDPADETATDYRDRQYEVWLTSYLTERGLTASWSHDKEGEPDLTFDFRGRQHLVSAKRPKAGQSIRNAVARALRDLKFWLKAKPDAVGVASICLDAFLLAEGERTQLLGGSTSSLRARFDDFWPARKPKLFQKIPVKIFGESIAGLILTVQGVVIERLTPTNERLTVATQTFLDPVSEIRSSRLMVPYWESWLKSLTLHLENARNART